MLDSSSSRGMPSASSWVAAIGVAQHLRPIFVACGRSRGPGTARAIPSAVGMSGSGGDAVRLITRAQWRVHPAGTVWGKTARSPAAAVERLGFEFGDVDAVETAHVDREHILAIP